MNDASTKKKILNHLFKRTDQFSDKTTFSLFLPHGNILKPHPFLPWLKSVSPPRLPGKIEFILQISAQTLLPAQHYFPDHSQSPQISFILMFLYHYFFYHLTHQLWAIWSPGRYFTHLCTSINLCGMWMKTHTHTPPRILPASWECYINVYYCYYYYCYY